MRSVRILSVSFATMVLASTAIAESMTRDDVREALEAARRSGTLLAVGDLGLTERELHPGRFPAAPATSSVTRAQVREALAEAQREGHDQVGDIGLTQQALHPGRYPTAAVAVGRSRDEVRAELFAAIERGDFAVGDSGLMARELHPQRYALVTPGRDGALQVARAGDDRGR